MLQGSSLTINNKRMQSAICFIPQYFLLMFRIFHYVPQWGDFDEIGIKLEYFADKIWLISSECVTLHAKLLGEDLLTVGSDSNL